MLGIQGVLSAAEVRRFVKRAQEGVNRTAAEGRYTGVWGAKTLFTPRDHPDLQAEPSADAPHG
jgi:hypothetical protein